jgi:hypothetical protein
MTTPPPDVVVLKCACCDLPFATIQRGVLMVNSRHHGDKHVNVVTLQDLIQWLRDLQAEAEPHTV